MKATATLFGETTEVELVVNSYQAGGRPAIIAMCEDGVYGVVTVNEPKTVLAEDEILVKTWTESVWVPQLLEQLPHVFKDTGRRVPMGCAHAQIWKFNREEVR